MSRDKIKKRLDIQKNIEGNSEYLKLLLSFLDKIKYESQWIAFVNVKHHRYGKFSYQCYTFYYPSEELLSIMEKNKKRGEK